MKRNKRTLVVTYEDMERLRSLLEATRKFHRDREYLAALEEELERAETVPAMSVPRDVVTMNSTVRVKDVESGKETTYTLVFPRDADFTRNRVSVLAPIGTALLGYRAGDVVEWRMPSGVRHLRIEDVVYQPESAKQAA
ncbi:MAG TPA: nucleoside diphosphate kinase regulator [Terriglobales bacterium]|nr:nucleoside diphosphate kinase regulator [Terriglobales bacterium]